MIIIHGIGILIMIIKYFSLSMISFLLLMGCATTNELPVFSPTSPTAELIAKDVVDDLESVRWAGVIIDAVNQSEGTVFEVLSYPVNTRGRPKLAAASQGRFFVESADYFELYDYAPGRLVQVYGTIDGWRASTLRQGVEHPVLQAKRINLLPLKEERSARSNFRFGLGVHLNH